MNRRLHTTYLGEPEFAALDRLVRASGETRSECLRRAIIAAAERLDEVWNEEEVIQRAAMPSARKRKRGKKSRRSR